jgi:4-carboxymuconolactone decarboxylase
MSRLPVRPEEELSEQEREIMAAILRSRGSLAGPFAAWLYSPELAERAQRLGESVRYHTSLPRRLSEFAILITAHHLDCHLEWAIHEPIARQAGVPHEVVEALRSGERPDFGTEEEVALYDYCREVLETKFVSDATYGRAIQVFEQKTVVELTILLGYYTLVAYTLNAFRILE